MKKFIVLFLAVLSSLVILSGCSGGGYGHNNNDDEISLTMDNYRYYLSFDTVCTSTSTTGVGRSSSFKMTISGAVNGLYTDCKLFYNTGSNPDNIREISLNAAGYATLNYSYSSYGDNDNIPVFVDAVGKIRFY